MTKGSIGGYTEAIQGRYLLASNREKGRILDASTGVISSKSLRQATAGAGSP